MADLGAIFSGVSRGSALTLHLYQIATESGPAADDLSRVAKSISNFSTAVKQVGTTIREDDSLPSAKAVEILNDLLGQYNMIMSEVELLLETASANAPKSDDSHGPIEVYQPSTAKSQRMQYLQAHLDTLKATVSVMQQTFYTAQAIIWGKLRPAISPQQADTAVTNEKAQLEALIIEQQMTLLSATHLYQPSRPDARLLMDRDSSMSVVARGDNTTQPADLHPYQNRFLTILDTTESKKHEWLPAVCGSAKSHVERLLDKWTRLRQFHEKISDEERHLEDQKRYTQQPSVESDGEEEIILGLGINDSRLLTPTPRRPSSIQPLFASPRSSVNSLASTDPTDYSPVSPRTSIASLPVEAAAAVEAKNQDDGLDLEIPWTLRTREYYWKCIDGKVKDSNTNLPSSSAFSDRNSWTEILASWVCAEAIQEARYSFKQGKQERQDGRRTKLETCFCIEQPLTFDQIQRLVERTVDIYRKNKPPTPEPSSRRTSFDRQPARHIKRDSVDRDRTPLASQHPPPPPLHRSTTAYNPQLPPPPPRTLDRTHSMPPGGPAFPTLGIPPQNASSHLHVSGPGSPYTNPQPFGAANVPANVNPYFAQPPSTLHPYPAPILPPQNPQMLDTRRSSYSFAMPQSPLRNSHSHLSSYSPRNSQGRHDYYSSASTTSDSDNAARSRSKSK
ncbi:hypothetical protein K491DRAFT_558718, partial [Lophiostoma macrostomum CBS 122681]